MTTATQQSLDLSAMATGDLSAYLANLYRNLEVAQGFTQTDLAQVLVDSLLARLEQVRNELDAR